MTSFLMNGAVCGYGAVLTTKVTQFKTDAIIFWEVTPFDSGNGNDEDLPQRKTSERHLKGSNVGCLDGHVDTIPLTEWQQELAADRSRLWCNPLTTDGR